MNANEPAQDNQSHRRDARGQRDEQHPGEPEQVDRAEHARLLFDQLVHQAQRLLGGQAVRVHRRERGLRVIGTASEGNHEYLRSLGLLHARGEGDFVMRANDVEYFAPAVFDDEIEVFARVKRIGRTSVTFEFAAYRLPDGALMVTAHQTLVYVDLAERKASPVPDAFRDPVLAFEGADVDA